MAAGIATLQELRDHPPYDRLEAVGDRAGGWPDPHAAANLPHVINRVGSMWTLFFTAGPVVDYALAKHSDTARFARFFWAMMDRGVYLPCSQFEAAFVSAAHTGRAHCAGDCGGKRMLVFLNRRADRLQNRLALFLFQVGELPQHQHRTTLGRNARMPAVLVRSKLKKLTS